MPCLSPISPTVLVIQSRWAQASEILHVSHSVLLDNNHTVYKHICLQGIGCVSVKNYPPEIMQPSSSTRATIVSAENQNGATIVKATFFFCHYYIVWESNNAGEARGQSWNESLKSRWIPGGSCGYTSGTKRKPFAALSSMVVCMHDGCSCNHRAVPPSDNINCSKKHSIATITQLRSLELLIAKTPLLYFGLDRQFDRCHGARTSSPSHWQQVEEQAPKPVGWMMCFLLMTFVPTQKLCVNIYIYVYIYAFFMSPAIRRIYTYNRNVIQYWWSCTPSHSIGL